MVSKGPVTLELRSSRLSRAQKILPSVARAWPITVFCADTATAVRRYRVLIAHNKHSPRSVSRSTVNTTLASRLNCAHCVFIAISRIALRANDASTTPKQRSPRFNYAPITFLVRLSQYHSDHAPIALATIIYKYRTTFWAASTAVLFIHRDYILQLSELCHQKTREEAVHGGNAEQ